VLVARFSWTSRGDGDLSGDLSGAHPGWTWLRQVHGPAVVSVTAPGEHAGAEADAAVTSTAGCRLVVRTADCAPIVLVGEQTVGVVHAGWRGLGAGVVGAAVAAMAALGGPPREAHVGPCIRPGCYEFIGPERQGLADRHGAGVLATTTWGTPALDLPALVTSALHDAGVPVVHDDAGCTACDRRWFSHRARGESGRFATSAWLEPA